MARAVDTGRAAYLAALVERLKVGPSPANWKATREAIALHLTDYLNGTVPAVDREIARFLVIAIEQARAKEVPALFTPLPRRRGESPNTAAVKSCITSAATYVLTAQLHRGMKGIDTAPVTTVARLFEVTTRTVMGWKVHGHAVDDITRYAFVRAGMLASAMQYARFGGAGSGAVRKRVKGETG